MLAASATKASGIVLVVCQVIIETVGLKRRYQAAGIHIPYNILVNGINDMVGGKNAEYQETA